MRVFAFTGAPELFVVPECVTRVTVELWGAQGGPSRCGVEAGYDLPDVQEDGGRGGWLRAELPVSSGELLVVHVGGRGGLDGAPGWNGGGRGGAWGGGGGGASDVRVGGASLADRVLVAGGGGGGVCGFPDHGAGGDGGRVGQDGVVGEPGWRSGGGGQPHMGGEAGSWPGESGVFGLGGGAAGYHVAGGGGGWYGGGGAFGAGGGGGSSHVDSAASGAKFSAGVRRGDGEVRISW